jgi:hypothetical protein
MAELAGAITKVPLKFLVSEKDPQVLVLNRNIAGKMVDYLIKIQSRNLQHVFIGHNLFLNRISGT